MMRISRLGFQVLVFLTPAMIITTTTIQDIQVGVVQTIQVIVILIVEVISVGEMVVGGGCQRRLVRLTDEA